MQILETDHLTLRQLEAGDAAFILHLVNEPSWLQYIGDKGVTTLEDAANYIRTGPVDMYRRLGFGLWLVELKPEMEPIGMCGLLRRDTLDDVDIGFALLPEYWNRGYAFEAAAATLEYAKTRLALGRVLAITRPDNAASCALLEKLGFALERLVRLSPDDDELRLYSLNLQ
ncbi:MAG: GNAT family N-acetyltransferase [Xanthomonadales bacterium]|nr:GNAT family N-acetyltransferase [Xanthomonadales bacterium]